jgi:hypothetical protein
LNDECGVCDGDNSSCADCAGVPNGDSVEDACGVCDGNIEKDQVIAESKGLFGLFKSQLKSPIDGTLANISNITGQALLSEPPIAVEVDAFSAGTIKEILPEEGVIVNSNGGLVQGILGIGGESHGEVVVAVNSRKEVIRKDMPRLLQFYLHEIHLAYLF